MGAEKRLGRPADKDVVIGFEFITCKQSLLAGYNHVSTKYRLIVAVLQSMQQLLPMYLICFSYLN
jgi:hypothetical protein